MRIIQFKDHEEIRRVGIVLDENTIHMLAAELTVRELAQKAMKEKDMTDIEITHLLGLLDREYQEAVRDENKGRAIGIALFRATVRRPLPPGLL